MTILQQPDALSFSMNLKPFKISATADVVFSLSQGDAVLLSQILSPNADGQVEISLRDVIHDRLSCQVPPTADPYQQSSVAADFTAVIDGQSVTFRVIRGGVDRLSGTVTDFLKANFLTWQPNVKPVTYSSPEFLSYYAVSSGCSLKVKAWFTDASGNATAGATKTICSLTKGVVTTVSVQYAVIAGLYAGSLPAYYDVWVASGSTALTYTQRYYANVMQSEEEQWIFFENSLGGIDTFRTFGAVSLDAEHTHHIAEIDDVAYEYRVDTERKWTVNTGHLDILERRWLLDFFPSAGKYVYAGSAVRRIVLTEDSVSYRFRELPSSYSFTFRFAEALPLLNLPRHELPVEMLDITVPDIGSFTLPPRLLEFSRLPLSEGVLFPVQSPYAEEWGVATLAGIAQYVSSLIDIPSPGISRNDIIRLLSAQLTPLDPLHPEDSLIDPSWLPESYGGTTDISHVAGLQNALDTLTGQLSNKLDVRFFNSIFTVYDSDGNAIVPNTYTQVADNLRILVGTWTDEYLSALGKNPSGGGSGGTGSVNSIKVAANVFRDPDSDGIIDLTADIVSSADRTRWNAASTNSHTHSNKSVLDGITAGKVSSWDAVASIMGTDSDTVINKWNEVVAFLDTYTEADTLANLLSNKLDVRFFNSIFTVYDSDGNAIVPNTYAQVADNLRILVGTWTDEYLSALGKNPSGGGSGGTGSVNSIKVAANVFRDPDSDGIIDLTADIVSSADRTRWNAASTNSHTHSNKSVLDGITAGKVSSWDAVASIMGSDSDTVINKWNEVVAFLDDISEESTLDGLLSAKANSSVTISAGNGLTGGGNLQANRSLSILLQTNSGLVASSSGLKLDIINNLTTNNVYKALSAAQGKALNDRLAILEAMFTREGSGTSADPYVIKANYGLYTDDFLSALGKNPSGGGSGTGSFDEKSMWTALGTTVSDKVIAASHIPGLAASKITSGTLAAARIPALAISKVSGLQDALDNVYTKTQVDKALGGYLPLSGGTLTGGLEVGGALYTKGFAHMINFDVDTSRALAYGWRDTNSNTVASIVYHNTAQNIILNPIGSANTYSDAIGKYSLFVGNNKLTYNTYPILHSNNYSSYALPLSGGTLKGNVTFNAVNKGIYLTDSNGDTYAAIINNAENLWIGARAVSDTHHAGGTYISAGSGNAYISRLVNSTRTNYIILDAGNYSSYALPLSGGKMAGTLSWSGGAALPKQTNPAILLSIDDFADGGTTKWVNAANVTVGSASKATTLAASRTIWGQSFNGSAAIKGTLFLQSDVDGANINSNSAKLKFNSSTLDGTSIYRSPYIQGVGGQSYGRKRLGFFQSNATNYTDDFVEAMSIFPNAHVSIGSTSDTYNLSVYNTGNNWALHTHSMYNNVRTSFYASYGGGQAMYIGSSSTSTSHYLLAAYKGITSEGAGGSVVMYVRADGRVGIGTAAPSYLLHVNGTMAGNECRALSDIRRKNILGDIHISVADIAAAPSILFTWKDETDKAVHGGTTAQYWQPIAPYYVNEGDDGALDLNYAGLALSASIENSKLLLTHDTEIELLKKENRELKMRVRKLERRVA